MTLLLPSLEALKTAVKSEFQNILPSGNLTCVGIESQAVPQNFYCEDCRELTGMFSNINVNKIYNVIVLAGLY